MDNSLLDSHVAQIASSMRECALRGEFDGRITAAAQAYLHACSRRDETTATILIFSRDTGHHSSGWMKNPDYERCWHLSLSVITSPIILPRQPQIAELDKAMTARWLRAFFGDDARYTWCESAKSPLGMVRGVMHWRLFCDEAWQPILPRGEVYSTEFTERGWRSASQVLEEDGRAIVSPVDPT